MIHFQSKARELAQRFSCIDFNGQDIEIDVESDDFDSDVAEERGTEAAIEWARDYCRISINYDWHESRNKYSQFDWPMLEYDLRNMIEEEFGDDAEIRGSIRPYNEIEIIRKKGSVTRE